MRCRSYTDARFFLPSGTMRLNVEPDQVFDTLDEYVAWLNRDAFDGWRFTPPDEVKTVRQCAEFLDRMVAEDLERHGYDESLPALNGTYAMAA